MSRRAPHRLAADQLDETLDLAARGERDGIVVPGDPAEVDAAILGGVAGTDGDHLDRTTGPLGERLVLAAEDAENRGSDGAETGDTDAQRRRHGNKLRQ